MSLREQLHNASETHHHSWKARMKDWFLLPVGHVPKRDGVTPAELRAHGSGAPRGWMSIDGDVYDVTQFMAYHPGGELIMQKYLGRDATAVFKHHHPAFTAKMAVPELLIGPLLPEQQPQSIGESSSATVPAVNKADEAPTAAAAAAAAAGSNDEQQLSAEEKESLSELFDQLLADGASDLSDLEFADFLRVTGVSDEDRQLTMSRLATLRAEGKSANGSISKDVFLSLF